MEVEASTKTVRRHSGDQKSFPGLPDSRSFKNGLNSLPMTMVSFAAAQGNGKR